MWQYQKGTADAGILISGPSSASLTMGNPSRAVADPNNHSNYLMIKAQYTLSYNREQGKPNWVEYYIIMGHMEKVAPEAPELKTPSLREM